MTTRFQTKEDALKNREWRIVDATDVPLGRIASEVAALLRGKNKPDFTPHVDVGDYVVVINAAKVKFTGAKLSNKIYYSHSGFIGGIKGVSAEDLLDRSPEKLVSRAITGMLPRGPLGRSMATKLKIYADSTHPHAAQSPKPHQLQSAV